MDIRVRGLVAASCLVVAAPCAWAVNFPTEVHVQVIDSATGPPTMLVDFMNNEGDGVWFVFEATFGGVVQPRWPGTSNGDAICVKSADPSSCDGVPTGGIGRGSTGKGHRAVEVLRVQRDTDYCFRIKADDGKRQSPWSAVACAHTPPLPRRPGSVPGLPLITLIDVGTNGRGDVGPARPGRVLVEWSSNASDMAWFAIERADAFSGPVTQPLWHEIGRVTRRQIENGSGLEFVESIGDPTQVPGPGRRVGYRVCAANIGGKSCSIASSYPSTLLKESAEIKPVLGRTPTRPVASAQVGVPAALAAATARSIASAPSPSATAGANAPAARVEAPAASPWHDAASALPGRPTSALPWGSTASSAFGATGLRSPR